MTVSQIIPERLEMLPALQLQRGSHPTFEAGACTMEVVSWIAGEPWSDHPECACPVISTFMRQWNDNLPNEDRTRLLLPLIPRLVGTRSTEDVEHRRSLMAADWLVRVHTPAWLRLAKLTAQAEALEALPEITSMAQVPSIRGPLDAAANDASAAWAAAGDAARDAAGAAAWDAAWAAAGAAAWDAARDAARAAAGAAAGAAARDAAGAAARDAAWDAARDAARAAAGAAAGAAARDALKPTVERLQTSGLALIERMIELKDAA